MVRATEFRDAGIRFCGRLSCQKKGDSGYKADAIHVVLLCNPVLLESLGSDGRIG